MDPSAKVKNVNTQSSIDTQDTSFPKISKTSSQDGHTHIDLELESIRIRSLSSCYPCLKNIYPAEFVPKPKPKKHESLPSPMNLNAKGFRHLKKNKVSAFILATDQL